MTEWLSLIWNSILWFSVDSWYFRVRMHYGHPDVFDRIFHITRGGISKASQVINISESIYAGTVEFSIGNSFPVLSNFNPLLQIAFSWKDSF